MILSTYTSEDRKHQKTIQRDLLDEAERQGAGDPHKVANYLFDFALLVIRDEHLPEHHLLSLEPRVLVDFIEIDSATGHRITCQLDLVEAVSRAKELYPRLFE